MSNLVPLLLATLLAWTAQFLFFLFYLRRRSAPARILSELRDEVDKLVAEVDAATDRDATLVEDRIRSLREILSEADRRIAALNRDLSRRSESDRLYTELGRLRRGRGEGADEPRSPGPAPEGPPDAGALPARSTARREIRGEVSPGDGGVDAGPLFGRPMIPAASPGPEGAGESGPGPDASGRAAGASARPEAPAPSQGPRLRRAVQTLAPHPATLPERVLELHRAGFSAELIASRLGTTVGEAELVIALAERKGDAAGEA